MAVSQTTANEKSGIYEEAAYDPDLEARLYAEIYYSNDNYQPETVSTSENVASASKASESLDSKNPQKDNNPEVAKGSNNSLFPPRTGFCDKDAENASPGLKQRFVKRPRLLAHKDLWVLPNVSSDTQRSINKNNFELREAESISERFKNKEFGDIGGGAARFGRTPSNSQSQNQRNSTGDRFIEARCNSTQFSEAQSNSTRFSTKSIVNQRNRQQVSAESISNQINPTQTERNKTPIRSTQFGGAQNDLTLFSKPQSDSVSSFGAQSNSAQYSIEFSNNQRNSTQIPIGSIINQINSTRISLESINNHKNSTRVPIESIINQINSTQTGLDETLTRSTRFGEARSNSPQLCGTRSDFTEFSGVQNDFTPFRETQNDFLRFCGAPSNSTQIRGVRNDFLRFSEAPSDSTQIRGVQNDFLRFSEAPSYSTQIFGEQTDSTQFFGAQNDFTRFSGAQSNPTRFSRGQIDSTRFVGAQINPTRISAESIISQINSTRASAESIINRLNSTRTEHDEAPINSTRFSGVSSNSTQLIRAQRNSAHLNRAPSNATRFSTGSIVNNPISCAENEFDEAPIYFTRYSTGSIEPSSDLARLSINSIEKQRNRTRSSARLRNRQNLILPELDELDVNFSQVLTGLLEAQNDCTQLGNENDEPSNEPIHRLSAGARRKAALAKKIEKRERRRIKRKAVKELKKRANANSKYQVIGKKNKLKMRQTEPVDISSDSDDSILEVPVPPKAPPPVIQLPDSDEDEESQTPRKKRKKHAENAPVIDSSVNTDEPEGNQRAKKTKNPENSQEVSSSERAGKSRSKKDKKSSKNSEDVVNSGEIENEETGQRTSKETGKKSKNADYSAANLSQTENEEDSGKSVKSRSKKSKKSSEDTSVETERIEENSVSSRELELQKILKEASKKARIAEEKVRIAEEKARIAEEKARIAEEKARNAVTISANPPADLETTNLILNCTEIQKGASSLEEIRKTRETVGNIHSDDSMTESEANNWVNIAAGQANCPQIENSTVDSVNTTLWDQITQESPTAETSNEIPTVETLSQIVEELNSTNEQINARKRHKETPSSPFNDFDVPAIPDKRPKQKTVRTSRDQTMEEYFFKPMSKEMQNFYNNPWGGENLDICDIQSRMPKNPDCWTILDSDLQGLSRRRRKLCPRCRTEAHFGKRCPEKAKPPCCYMCGAQGHSESRCPHTMCLTCGRKYATYRPVCGFCTNLHCTMCNGTGHSYDNCPDLWRRYHNTTTETLPIPPLDATCVMKPAQKLICCNCSKRGHDISTCRQLRWSQHFQSSMQISSYTSGPCYELTSRDRLLNPVFSGNSSYVVPADEFFEPTTSEAFGEVDHGDNIELPDLQPANPAPRPDISIPNSQIIFQSGEIRPHDSSNWIKKEERLDTIEGLHLTGLLAGTLQPSFLNDYQDQFEFSAEIRQNPDSGLFLILRSRTVGILNAFETLLFQWLRRSDTEKAYLSYKELSFVDVNRLNQELKIKLMMLRTVKEPSVLLKKITACDIAAIQTSANINKGCPKKNERRLSCLRTNFGISMNRRCQLVTSLYSGSWVEGGDEIVASFRQLAHHRVLKLGKPLPRCNFLSLVYLYHEIFTFHETPALKLALQKAMAQQPDAGNFAYPSDEVSRILEREVSAIQQNLPVCTDSSGFSQSPVEPNIPTANLPNTPGNKFKRKAGRDVCLSALSKSLRHSYRRMADSLMSKAQSSKDPHLRELADTLKSKMKNSSARTQDVLLLHDAVNGKNNVGINPFNTLAKFASTRKLRIPKNLRKVARPCKVDPKYVDFLKGL